MIHKENPYENFNHTLYPLSIKGWHSNDPFFHKMIDLTQPSLIIEVGTWKGASSIYMASYMRDKGIKGKILCIDTWLGSVDFWTDLSNEEKYLSLGLKNGFPSVYYQFLANVKYMNLEEYIIPFPQTSLDASRWLKIKGIKAELCYIDASHNRDDVYNDLYNYWSLITNEGVICGDDYDEYWPTVKSAVDAFVEENKLNLSVTNNKWSITKSKDILNQNKSIKMEIQLLNELIQEIQHTYLLHQEKYNQLQEKYNQLNVDYIELKKVLDNSIALKIAKTFYKYPPLAKIIDSIHNILLKLKRN